MTFGWSSRLSWAVLRVTLAGLIAAHGWTRLLPGGVEYSVLLIVALLCVGMQHASRKRTSA